MQRVQSSNGGFHYHFPKNAKSSAELLLMFNKVKREKMVGSRERIHEVDEHVQQEDPRKKNRTSLSLTKAANNQQDPSKVKSTSLPITKVVIQANGSNPKQRKEPTVQVKGYNLNQRKETMINMATQSRRRY
ncbi:hypothetical protein RJT34_02406 [Clitoria ternatea]|uniref:Uncharacterized protein n=1 Tax=Clitoria ternatea TaxID=43366 RepID=A0AAN9Q0X6_CLITE